MDKIRFLLDDSVAYATVLKVSDNVINITFSKQIPEESTLLNGFEIINENNGKSMTGDFYHLYNTVYHKIDDNTVMLSNDGSIYVEPENVTSEPIELTEEEKIELEKQNKIHSLQLEISTLKSELAESDYIVIKCQEYLLAGKDLPDEYDIAKFSEERDIIRTKINVLEEELNNI